MLVSGLGATPVMELYVLYNEVEKDPSLLKASKYTVPMWGTISLPWI